ncbi:MAG TPA: hypothetical protein VIJ25_11140, partial [Methylococcales bacterium]
MMKNQDIDFHLKLLKIVSKHIVKQQTQAFSWRVARTNLLTSINRHSKTMTFSSPQVNRSTGDDRMFSMNRNRWVLILSFILSAYMLFGRLGGWPLISPDEGRNAE